MKVSHHSFTINAPPVSFVILLVHSEKLTAAAANGYTVCMEVREMEAGEVNEEMWRAIVRNDSKYDGKFFYAVITTGIFCRPSCKSRPPMKENVRIFRDAEHAAAAGFRPCKRCKPANLRLPDEDWVASIADWIDRHYNEPITLGALADLFHGSPYHLQRTFKRIKGLSPAEYIQHVRMAKAMNALASTNKPVTSIAAEVGIPNAAHFATLFQRKTGLSPTAYRNLNAKGNDKRRGGA
jgi:AraC family transcriptional regulator of adaptative response / methylphosphotriester-DNA alkyltransferase methyltransferase